MVLLLSGKDCEFFPFQQHDSQMQKIKHSRKHTELSRNREHTTISIELCRVVQSD